MHDYTFHSTSSILCTKGNQLLSSLYIFVSFSYASAHICMALVPLASFFLLLCHFYLLLNIFHYVFYFYVGLGAMYLYLNWHLCSIVYIPSNNLYNSLPWVPIDHVSLPFSIRRIRILPLWSFSPYAVKGVPSYTSPSSADASHLTS